ncbi:sigma 54-interacting transcriptional regulator [Pontiellaceae bacterium B1224]|nr:sigma 54-interacting transcriptional regulator [Pontiellaceae bacterium B1224]
MPQTLYSLEDALQFESLLIELSARFINLSAHQVDTEIEDAQRRVCECLGLHLSSLWQWDAGNPDLFLLTHLYREEGGPEVPGSMSGSEHFPWGQKQILAKKPLAVSSAHSMPPEAAIDQENMLYFGVKASLDIPLVVGEGPVFGVLGFCDMEAERVWSGKLIHRLELVAQIFANALARKKSEEELRLSEQRLNLATESAGAGWWSLDVASGCFWMTPAVRAMHGYTPDEVVDVKRFLGLVYPEDRENVQQILDAVIQERNEGLVEYRIDLNGQLRWMAARGRVQCEDHQKADALMGVTVDVTEQRLNEERLTRALQEVGQLRDQLEKENTYLREQLGRNDGQDAIVGESKPVLEMIAQAQQVAPTDSSVLITGETGTGKELLAQAIHSMSPRKSKTMIKVNCAALPAALIEGELFGREKGAYTGAMTRQSGRFEVAHHSTIFLDEIGELPLDLQSKLLRVLQDGQFERLGSHKTLSVDVRIVAATNRDLAAMVREGEFREDLFHRLNVFPIEVPALRERKDDIPLLVWKTVEELNSKMGRAVDRISKSTMERLKKYPWPGNIRELRNNIERAMIISAGRALKVHFPEQGLIVSNLPSTLEEVERAHILRILESTGWRISGKKGAAEILGLLPTTLHARLKKLGLSRPAR